jgi:hypothetical protein
MSGLKKYRPLISTVFWIGRVALPLLVMLSAMAIYSPSPNRKASYGIGIAVLMLMVVVYLQMRKLMRWRDETRGADKKQDMPDFRL